eukprot:1158266-Pelagomonas_calceolata.AAC.10
MSCFESPTLACAPCNLSRGTVSIPHVLQSTACILLWPPQEWSSGHNVDYDCALVLRHLYQSAACLNKDASKEKTKDIVKISFKQCTTCCAARCRILLLGMSCTL